MVKIGSPFGAGPFQRKRDNGENPVRERGMHGSCKLCRRTIFVAAGLFLDSIKGTSHDNDAIDHRSEPRGR